MPACQSFVCLSKSKFSKSPPHCKLGHNWLRRVAPSSCDPSMSIERNDARDPLCCRLYGSSDSDLRNVRVTVISRLTYEDAIMSERMCSLTISFFRLNVLLKPRRNPVQRWREEKRLDIVSAIHVNISASFDQVFVGGDRQGACDVM